MTVRCVSLDEVSTRGALVTIGTFDGVHLGHQLLDQPSHPSTLFHLKITVID